MPERDGASFAFLVRLQTLSRKKALPYSADTSRKEYPMLDIIMLVIGPGFFALSVGYAFACDEL